MRDISHDELARYLNQEASAEECRVVEASLLENPQTLERLGDLVANSPSLDQELDWDSPQAIESALDTMALTSRAIKRWNDSKVFPLYLSKRASELGEIELDIPLGLKVKSCRIKLPRKPGDEFLLEIDREPLPPNVHTSLLVMEPYFLGRSQGPAILNGEFLLATAKSFWSESADKPAIELSVRLPRAETVETGSTFVAAGDSRPLESTRTVGDCLLWDTPTGVRVQLQRQTPSQMAAVMLWTDSQSRLCVLEVGEDGLLESVVDDLTARDVRRTVWLTLDSLPTLDGCDLTQALALEQMQCLPMEAVETQDSADNPQRTVLRVAYDSDDLELLTPQSQFLVRIA